jgi:GT2 family glycosyltransferase
VKASVIIVCHAGAHLLDDSIASLVTYAEDPRVEVVLVDNASDDQCGKQAQKKWPWLKLVRSQRNVGFAGGVHLGVEAAVGEVLVLLNDDAAAGGHFVESHLDVLGSNPQAALSAGRLLSWDGKRHDFLRGGVTFDAHAFQLGQGFEIERAAPPAVGEALPFACGGNMAVRREDWEASGGFDRNLFAYFEDIDLGWRLWACGREVVAAPDAVARHRGAATSNDLGDLRRGVLFERNALRTFHACADDECRAAFGQAVWATFLHRMVVFAREQPELARAVVDPFSEGASPRSSGDPTHRRRREFGPLGATGRILTRLLFGGGKSEPVLDDGLLLMQLRAAEGFFSSIDRTDRRRAELEEMRKLPDREILQRFPRLVVPTYPGDKDWFSSAAFKAMLPVGWPLEHRALDDIMRLE